MDTRRITSANRAAWDEAAPIHAQHNQARLIEQFRDPAFTLLNDVETARLTAIGVEGKDVAQICCNNGRELICVNRMGAKRCVGFDGSTGFVEQARELNEAAGAGCTFVCTDIYDMPAEYDASFDVVTITVGVLSWMPDLSRFFGVLTRIMRPGAALFIYEQHPVVEMMKAGDPEDPVAFELSYFTSEPYVETGGLDYWSGEIYDAKPATSFIHTLSDVIMAGIDHGLAVEHFEEFPTHISNGWYNVEHQIDGFPMSYTAVFRKASAP